MVKIWIVKPNIPEDWKFDTVEIVAGKRYVDEWINKMKLAKFIKCIEISDQDDGCEFLNQIAINLETTSES